MKFLLFWMGVAGTAWAQQPAGRSAGEYTIDLFDNPVKIEKIAIPDFLVDVPGAEAAAAKDVMMRVIKADLGNAGFFEIIDLGRFASLGNPHVGPIDFEEWGSVEADHLVIGALKDQDGQLRVEIRLYEIATRRHILAKAYRGRPKLARKMAHVIADDIMFRLRNVKFATSKIIFARDSPSKRDPLITNKELFLMDYDGENSLPITRGGLSFAPAALRIGNDTRLVYCAFEKPDTLQADYNIYFKPTLLSRPKPLLAGTLKRASAPALSPDGKKVVFSMAVDGNVDLYLMNVDGSDFLRLTRHPGVDTNPSWSPGGNALLFTSDRIGSPQIYQMDADGLNKRRITTENPYNDSAVWNPVYNYIAYVSRFDNDFDIFIMDMRDGTNYRVTNRQGSNETPCWSPSGNQLCFASNRTGQWQLYVVNLNGRNLRQVTFSGNNRSPAWVAGD